MEKTGRTREFNSGQRGVEKLARERVLEVVKKFDPEAEVKILSPQRVEVKIDEPMIPRIIGRGGSRIKELEEMLSMHIDVEPRERATRSEGTESGSGLFYDYRQKGGSIELMFEPEDSGKVVNAYADDQLLFQATISRKATIKIPKKSENGAKIIRAMKEGEDIRITES